MQHPAVSLLDRYPFRVIVALDIFVNGLTGGHLGETISARLGRWLFGRQPGGVFAEATVGKLAALLDWLQRDHVLDAIQGSRDRAAALVALEDRALAAYRQAHPNP